MENKYKTHSITSSIHILQQANKKNPAFSRLKIPFRTYKDGKALLLPCSIPVSNGINLFHITKYKKLNIQVEHKNDKMNDTHARNGLQEIL